jgi:hypothetical protein
MISIYKPNKSNTGVAFTFQMGEGGRDKEYALYMHAIQQHSWDDQKKVGSFSENKKDPNKTLTLKFNETECGSIISAIENRFEYHTFHSHDSNKTSIKLVPWDKKTKLSKFNQETKQFEENWSTLPAFGLSVSRNGNQTFKLPLEPGECQCVIELIKLLLQKIYIARLEKVENYKREKMQNASISPKDLGIEESSEEQAPF